MQPNQINQVSSIVIDVQALYEKKLAEARAIIEAEIKAEQASKPAVQSPVQAQVQRLSVFRYCAKCQKALTVPASIECGIGPECRNKATLVLEKEIPTDWNPETSWSAMAVLNGSEAWPTEARVVLDAVSKAIFESAGFGGNACQTGKTWRKEVEQLTWLASFTLPEMVRRQVSDCIRGLGHVSYANYLDKIAAASAGELWIDDTNTLNFSCKRNKSGNQALKAEVNGLTPVLASDKELFKWQAPLSSGAAFISVIKKYWPLTEVEKVQPVVDAVEQVAKSDISKRKTVYIKRETIWLIVPGSPIIPFKQQFVEDLKSKINYVGRKWDSARRNWIVLSKCFDELNNVLVSNYPEIDFVFI